MYKYREIGFARARRVQAFPQRAEGCGVSRLEVLGEEGGWRGEPLQEARQCTELWQGFHRF